MFKHNVLVSVLLFGFAGLASHGQDLPVQAKITPALTEVRINQAFSVSVVITNTSGEIQALEFSTCGEGIAWNVDNPSVRPHGEGACLKPGQLRVELKPGEAYERTLHAHVELAEGIRLPESVTFRLELYYEDHGTRPKGIRFWSNAATITVTR